ncbi:unnamed protein product, partial [marine sediment metagenome]
AVAVDEVLTFTVDFDVGTDTFNVTILSTPAVGATINYDTWVQLHLQEDAEVQFDWNDASSVTGVTYGVTTLTADEDYTVIPFDWPGGEVGAWLVIKNAFIVGIDPAVAVDDVLTFTVDFDVGDPDTFTVTILSTPAPPAVGATVNFDTWVELDQQQDAETQITWNDASSVTGVTYGGTPLTADEDYTVTPFDWPGGAEVGAWLAIKNAFFVGLEPAVAVDDVLTFTVVSDVGDPDTFTVTILSTPAPPAVGATVNFDTWVELDQLRYLGPASSAARCRDSNRLERRHLGDKRNLR